MTDAKEQRIVHVEGDVQGIGFRYTACRLAAGHDVTGYVRNLPDGGVECVIEGAAGEIDALIEEIKSALGYHIRHVRQQKAPHSGSFSSFGVKF
ncbi:MAG: acylphosphatase [Phycisphaerae bacterium]|jgi:acylphosphatase